MILSAATETSATPQVTKGTSSSPNSTLGKDQFLKLLIEQIKNQDPLSPMQNTEFTAQMAQFSSLEQLYNVNSNLGKLAQSNAAVSSAQAMGMIGKTVKAAGNSIEVTGGNPSQVSFTLPKDSAATKVIISDAKGQLVASIDAGALKTGDNTVAWDGRDASGAPVADGVYTYTVDARNLGGEAVQAATFLNGTVRSVSMENNNTYLNIGNTRVLVGDVMEVANPAAAAAVKNKDGIF